LLTNFPPNPVVGTPMVRSFHCLHGKYLHHHSESRSTTQLTSPHMVHTLSRDLWAGWCGWVTSKWQPTPVSGDLLKSNWWFNQDTVPSLSLAILELLMQQHRWYIT
jgi:hypothetical protein